MKDPNLRLGSTERDADEISEHPWFSTTDWAEMISKTTKPPYTPQLEDPTDVKHFSTGFTNKDPYGSYNSNLSLANSGTSNKWDGFSFEGSMNDLKLNPDYEDDDIML